MKTSSYKAAVLTAPGSIEIRELPVPSLEPWEALVRVRYAGVCGTDLAIFSGSYATNFPIVVGHEFAGEVVDVGDTEYSDWIGMRVTAEINNTCVSRQEKDLCPLCRAGLTSHCQTRTVLGIAGADGVFAELVRVPVRNLYALPESVQSHLGVFVEPLAAAIQTFELTPLAPGVSVVVFGAGRLGVLACKVASLKGARVIAVSRSPYKLQLAKKMGANVLIDADGKDPREEVIALTNGVGADVVVEATGTREGLALALDMVRPRGTICAKSTPGGDIPAFPLTRVVVDEITIQGSRCGPFGKAIRMMARHQLGLDVLISERYPLSEMARALEAAKSKFKVLIDIT